jgi:hypothetical protein
MRFCVGASVRAQLRGIAKPLDVSMGKLAKCVDKIER